MPLQSENSNQSATIFLSFLYAVISISANSLTVLPDTGNAEFRLGIFVPALAAIIYGPLTGGLTAGIGNLLIDTYGVVTGSIDTLGFDRILGSLANFVGGYLTGWFARKARSEDGKIVKVKYIPAYTMAAIIGLALVTGTLIGYGILYGYSQLPLSVAESVFEAIFFYNSTVLFVMMFVSLMTYEFFNGIQQKRFESRDERNRELTVEYAEKGVKISKLELSDHSLWVDEWNPLKITVKNTEKSPTSFKFEMVSDALVFPQIDRSNSLNPGEKYIQTFYIHPKQKRQIRMRFHVKNVSAGKNSILNIKAESTQVYKQDSLAGFSSVNVLVFVLSVLWSNVIESLNKTFSFNIDNIILISTFIITETAILAIYVFLNFKKQKKRLEEFKKLDLALTSDPRSYKIIEESEEAFQKSKKSFFLVVLFLRLVESVVVVFLFIEGYRSIFTDKAPLLPDSETLTFAISISVLLVAIISESILNPSKGENVFVGDSVSPVLISFNPAHRFKMGEPNEVTITVQNSILDHGMRVVFKSSNYISPEIIELKATKGQQATFKISITPLEAGVQNMLFAIYPLYTKSNKFIEFQAAEMIQYQMVSYSVLETTVLGMTNDQFEFLKNVGGLGSILVGAILTVNQFVGIDNLILRFRNSLPIIILLQLPLIYFYFFFTNKFSKSA